MQHKITPNLVFRTAFSRASNAGKAMQYLHVCPYCKASDTDVVCDDVVRAEFKKYWHIDGFTVRSCPSCTAIWSDGDTDARDSAIGQVAA